MSTWDEKARRAANPQCGLHRDCDHLMRGEHRPETFTAGARWQREALLSDEAVERAARGIHASHDRGEDFDNEPQAVQDEYLDMGLAALTAAIEGEDEPGVPVEDWPELGWTEE